MKKLHDLRNSFLKNWKLMAFLFVFLLIIVLLIYGNIKRLNQTKTDFLRQINNLTEKKNVYQNENLTLLNQNIALLNQINAFQKEKNKYENYITKEEENNKLKEIFNFMPPFCLQKSNCGEGYDREKSYQKIFKQTIESYRNQLRAINYIENGSRTGTSRLFEIFFNNSKIEEFAKEGEMCQLCFSDYSNISFVMFGKYAKNNNLLGNYSNDNLITTSLNVPKGGDIALCRISGSIKNNTIYECSAGDGPWSWHSVYMLNKKSNEIELVKSCTTDSSDGGDTKCDVNQLFK